MRDPLPWWYQDESDVYLHPEECDMAATTPTPDGVTLHPLPDGRTLVRDDNVPEAFAATNRWRVLRPGWQEIVRLWLPESRRYSGWWTALVAGGYVEDVPAEELGRLVDLMTRRQ